MQNNQINKTPNDPLTIAFYASNYDKVSKLLKTGECSIDVINTLLIEAIERQNYSAIELLQGKCSIDALDQALFKAATSGEYYVIGELLKTERCSKNAINTLLVNAINCFNNDLINLLLKTGQYSKDVINTLLIEAAKSGADKVIELLLNTAKCTSDAITKTSCGKNHKLKDEFNKDGIKQALKENDYSGKKI